MVKTNGALANLQVLVLILWAERTNRMKTLKLVKDTLELSLNDARNVVDGIVAGKSIQEALKRANILIINGYKIPIITGSKMLSQDCEVELSGEPSLEDLYVCVGGGGDDVLAYLPVENFEQDVKLCKMYSIK